MTRYAIHSPFYAFQILQDLRSVAAGATDDTLSSLAALIPTGATAHDLASLIHDAACRLTPNQRTTLHPLLLLAAALPDQNIAACTTATAVLLADRLQHGAGPDDLYHHWDSLRGLYPGAPVATAAALRRGYVLCHRAGLVQLDTPPGGADVQSRTEAEVLASLRDLARTLSPADVAAVAQADYGREADRHAAALTQLLHSTDALLPESEDRFFPGEVVERSSLLPATPGFAACTALVLIEAIRRTDPLDLAATRWGIVGARYLDLPATARSPILAGFRHLTESLPGWSPYPDRDAIRVARDGVALPFP